MAFLDVSALANGATYHFPEAFVRSATFDRRERKIVGLARRDSLASLSDPTWVARLVVDLLGGQVNNRLADPRLEALRHMAVLAWRYEYALPRSAVASFAAAGFLTDQLKALLAGVVSNRTNSGRSAHP